MPHIITLIESDRVGNINPLFWDQKFKSPASLAILGSSLKVEALSCFSILFLEKYTSECDHKIDLATCTLKLLLLFNTIGFSCLQELGQNGPQTTLLIACVD